MSHSRLNNPTQNLAGYGPGSVFCIYLPNILGQGRVSRLRNQGQGHSSVTTFTGGQPRTQTERHSTLLLSSSDGTNNILTFVTPIIKSIN